MCTPHFPSVPKGNLVQIFSFHFSKIDQRQVALKYFDLTDRGHLNSLETIHFLSTQEELNWESYLVVLCFANSV